MSRDPNWEGQVPEDDDEFECPGCGCDPCECDQEDYRDDDEDDEP